MQYELFLLAEHYLTSVSLRERTSFAEKFVHVDYRPITRLFTKIRRAVARSAVHGQWKKPHKKKYEYFGVMTP